VQEGGIEPDIAVPQLTDPDYKVRPVIREADLRQHLVNETGAGNSILEEDGKADPRFQATPDELKKKGVDDFQLYYALQTIGRLGPAPQMAASAPAAAAKPKPKSLKR
jgi:carboxyl-terminal processing protease